MKILLTIFFFCFSLSLGTGQQFHCPVNSDHVPINGTFPDPNYCFVYYHCINGVAYPQQCPPGLFFTMLIKNCKYHLCVPENQADCPNQSMNRFSKFKTARGFLQRETQLSMSEGLKNTFVCEPNNDGTFPNPNDCRQYYHCVNGVAWPQQCPNDYAFSPTFNIRDCNVEICIPRERARCPVNGGWSEWSEFSDCMPNCGDGVRARFRECNNPPPSNGGALCPGNSVDLEECNLGDCLQEHPAFFISNRRTKFPVVNYHHKFDKIYINNGNMYNTTSETVRVKEKGYYWFNFVVTNQEYRGHESDATVSAEFLRRFVSASVTDEMNSIIHRQPEDKELYRVAYNNPQVLGSEDGAETSWLGYKINSPYLYYAQRNQFVNDVIKVVSYTSIKISEGFNGSSTITVPKTGYYFISFSFGQQLTSCEVTMRKNYEEVNEMTMKLENILDSRTSDMKSKSIIIKFNSGDTFDFFVKKGNIFSNSGRKITLSSYYIDNSEEIVTVVKNTSFSSGLHQRVTFDYELQNVGNSWNAAKNEFKCKNGGLYKVSVSLGIQLFRQTFGTIQVNGRIRGRLFSYAYQRHDRFVSRTLLLNLKANDVITLHAQGGLDGKVTSSVLNILRVSK